MSLHIKNGRVVEATGAADRVIDIYLQNGKIVGLGSAPNGFRAEQVIDAGNHLILPGLIDIQARLRDPGQPEKANIESETEAAVKNGITSLCIPPDTQPPIDNSATVELIHHRNEMYGHQARTPARIAYPVRKEHTMLSPDEEGIYHIIPYYYPVRKGHTIVSEVYL